MGSRFAKDYFIGKNILITGAASGFGRALAMKMAKAGGRVIVTDIDLKGAEETANTIKSDGDWVTSLHLDVTNRDEFEQATNKVVHEHGSLDMLVNNAGIAAGGEFLDRELETWSQVLDVNLMGVLTGTKLAYDIMVKQGHGQIVNISSVYGQVPSPMIGPYGTSKMAVFALSRALRWEAENYNIKINVVTPGYIDTNLIASGTYPKITAEEAISVLPFKIMSADTAAIKTLKGIVRNKAVISFPWYVRPYWWSYRLFPRLTGRIYSKLMNDFRSKKT